MGIAVNELALAQNKNKNSIRKKKIMITKLRRIIQSKLIAGSVQ